MKRLHWFKLYLTQSNALRNFYIVCLAHLVLQLLLLVGVRQYQLELLLIVDAFGLTAYALIRFIYRLFQFSSTDFFPQDVFTYEVVKSGVGFAFTAVLAIPSAQLLWKITQGELPAQAIPITWQGLIFIYGFSIYVWLFYLMSRLLNVKLDNHDG